MRTLSACALAMLAACGGGPVAPEWQSQSRDALEKFRQHYFAGDSRAAARSFAQAKSAMSATGRPDLVARAELYRCAIGVAALDFEACGEYMAMRGDASVEDRAYGDFVTGAPRDAIAVNLLPPQYGAVAAARDEPARERAIASVADPVSRLVAAGAAFRRSESTPEGIRLAVDTASAQGWRRPLLAWLQVQARRAEAAGDAIALEAIRRRIDVVTRSAPASPP